MRRFLVLGLALTWVASPSYAEVTWTGDFETGSLKQWWVEQMTASDRIRVVTDPTRQGRYAGKFIVRQGDNPISASGNRNELVAATREATGSEYYYGWSTLFPTSFPDVNKWQLIVQWHQEATTGCPPVEFYVVGNQLRLRLGGCEGKVVWTAPINRGKWHDFAFHVKWSPNPKVGFVELYHNGKLALSKRMIATQFANNLNYLKMGLYRDASISQEGVVYHDGMVQATRLEDVLPSPAPEDSARGET
ncbi:MAG TPA: polysaccharide lyase, partial [Myxococcaceae bacterium]|nr:polysaccharide lyase [Myxococcaceae bacterium]